MPLDPTYSIQNRAATQRIRELIASLSSDDYDVRVGEHWTAAITLAHLAFWDRRILFIIEQSERLGKFQDLNLDTTLNDIFLPFWAAIPASEAAKLALENAEAADRILEAQTTEFLEEMYAYNPRLVIRAWHRNEHLDEVDRALESR